MIYQFDDFELDPANYCLKKYGQNVEIEPQVFDLITYLVENHNRLVTRKEIFEQLWTDKSVLDATLSNHIKSSRSLLGDDGQSQSVIKTIRGRGYQFVAKVHTLEPEIDQHSSNISETKKRTLLTILSLTFFVFLFFIISYLYNKNSGSIPVTNAIITPKSIAVLPFKNHGSLEQIDFFTDGIHDDLLTQISKIDGLKTISRTSVMSYRNTKKNIRLIGKELGVTKILEGGVQRAGDKIRINAQLIDVLTDKHLWAETYTRDLSAENIFSIQTEISKAIADQLKLVLSPSANKIPTQNLAALEYYFKSKTSASSNTALGYREAIKYLELAIKLDPSFAIAYAKLGAHHLDLIYWDGLPVQQQIDIAKPLINKALHHDNGLSEVYLALGKLYAYEQKFDDANAAFLKAIDLKSNIGETYKAYGAFFMWYRLNYSKAVEMLIKAKGFNPNDDTLNNNLAHVLIRVQRYDEALQIVEDIIKRKPDFPAAYRVHSDILFYGFHQLAESQRALRKNISLDPGVPMNSKLMGISYIHTGDKELAIKWLEYSIALAPNSTESGISQAKIYELNGEYDKAFNIYLTIDKDPIFMFDFMKLGSKTNRINEVFERYQKIYTPLFESNVVIDSNNFIPAIAVSRVLKFKGNISHSQYLLEACLNYMNTAKETNWKDNNEWKALVHLGMGNNHKALDVLLNLSDDGFHSEIFINNPDYQVLASEPKFQKILVKMKKLLVKERSKLREMEARGELDIPPLLIKHRS